MVLGLKPMGKLDISRNASVLDRTKVLHGSRTQTYGKLATSRKALVLNGMEVLHGPRTSDFRETNTQWCLFECLNQVQSCIGPRTRHLKQVKAMNIIGNAKRIPNTQQPPQTVYFRLHVFRRSPRSQYRMCSCYPG